MDPKSVLRGDVVLIRENMQFSNLIDVDMRRFDWLKEFHSLDCHIVLYPYSRTINSEQISFHPFEEYVKDILTSQKSAYVQMHGYFGKIFGLLLGLAIILVFLRFKPEDLLSVESVVAVFAAYFFGKEMWNEIESILVEFSKSWRLRFVQSYYSFALEKNTTLTRYSRMAKERRYGMPHLLPVKIDFIEQSNSQTLRMFFNVNDLFEVQSETAHLMSIRIEPDLEEEFAGKGFLLGVKLCFNKRFMGLTRSLEVFQSFDDFRKGCLDEEGVWHKNAVFYRRTVRAGRLKWYLKKGIHENASILSSQSRDAQCQSSEPPENDRGSKTGSGLNI